MSRSVSIVVSGDGLLAGSQVHVHYPPVTPPSSYAHVVGPLFPMSDAVGATACMCVMGLTGCVPCTHCHT